MPNAPPIDHIYYVELEVGIRQAGVYTDVLHPESKPALLKGEVATTGAGRRVAPFDVGPGNVTGGAVLSNAEEIVFDVSRCKHPFDVDLFASTGENVLNCDDGGSTLPIDGLTTIRVDPGEMELSLGPEVWRAVADQIDVHCRAEVGVPFACRACGFELWIHTPYINLDQWCSGECDQMRPFTRVE